MPKGSTNNEMERLMWFCELRNFHVSSGTPIETIYIGLGEVARESDVNNQEWKLLQLYNFEWFFSKAGIN